MATSPELLQSAPDVVIRPMTEMDVVGVVALERAILPIPLERGDFPRLSDGWIHLSRGDFGERLIGYGVMSVARVRRIS